MSIFTQVFKRRRFLSMTAIALVASISASLLPVPLKARTPSGNVIY